MPQGFMSATLLPYASLVCSDSPDVLEYTGHAHLLTCRRSVMAHFNTQNGYEADCDVIYGDTDSVMVDFRVCSRLLECLGLWCLPRHPSSS